MTQDFEVEEENIFDLVLKSRADQFKKNTVPQTYVSNNNREEIPWYGLENGQESVIRIIGDPPSPKRKNNWNGKFIFYSELLTDSKKRYSDILWHTEINPHGQSQGVIDRDWILHRLFDTVYKKSWENKPFIDDKGYTRKGKYIFEHETTSVYKLLESNELELNNNVKIYPKKPKPSKRVILPVLVRNEGSSQIKILTTKHSVKEYTDSQGVVKQQVYCDFGIPVSETDTKKYLYDLILDEIGDNYKHWDLDIVIKKNKLTDIQIAYSIHACYSDSVSPLAKSYVTTFPEMRDVTVMINNKPIITKKPERVLLTQEELNLPKPDIDKLFQETTYKKLYTYHKELFRLADTELGTSFYPELVELFKKESPENASKIPAEKITLPVKENIVSGNTSVTSVPEPNAVRTRLPVTDVIQETIPQQCSRVFTNWMNLTDSEQKLMVSTIDSFIDDVPKFKSEYSKDMCVCNCDKQFLKKDGSPSGKPVSCHFDIKNCPMCEQVLT
jgi:hypothetical protein